ncbi:MAG: GNAT family N-acetyltransferase [Bacillota bacterium]
MPSPLDLEPVLETSRLVFAEATAEVLSDLLAVFSTNPAYVNLIEGPAGYGLAQLQRDWQVASMTPGRHMWAILRKSDAAAVGLADFLDDNPFDHTPWLGLLVIRGDLQGQGYGTEALEALLAYFRDDRLWPVVRIGVIAANRRALAWWQRRGFRPIHTVRRRLPAGETEIICLERQLRTPGPARTRPD